MKMREDTKSGSSHSTTLYHYILPKCEAGEDKKFIFEKNILKMCFTILPTTVFSSHLHTPGLSRYSKALPVKIAFAQVHQVHRTSRCYIHRRGVVGWSGLGKFE